MLMPKRTKYRKIQKGKRRGTPVKGSSIDFCEHALQAVESGWLTSRQIEAARVAMTRYVRRGGKVWIKIFPHKPITQKAAETRMGSGKGTPEYWVAVVKPGRVLYELSGIPFDEAKEAMRLASHKLPFKTKFITRSSDGMG